MKGRLIVYNEKAQYWILYRDTALHIPKETEEKVRFIKFSEFEQEYRQALASFSNRIDTSVDIHEENINSWNPESQDILINKAANALVENHCSVMLGAGISVDAGSPNWDNLLKGLLQRFNVHHNPIEREDYSDVNGKCGWSALITARYIIPLRNDDNVLISNMRDLIYSERRPCEYKKTPTALPIIANIIRDLDVDNAITFNYDEFLEEALENIGVTYTSVFNKGTVPITEFPIFHVHGMIARDTNGATCPPVLSEKEYHLLYSDPHHWSNVEILHTLTRNTCFLVGLSMTDPNLRRLLDISKAEDSEEARHFIFMRKDPLGEETSAEKNQKHWKNLECQFRSLGLNIIWFDYNPADKGDFTDLARKLQTIYDKAIEIKVNKNSPRQ